MSKIGKLRVQTAKKFVGAQRNALAFIGRLVVERDMVGLAEDK